MHCCVDANLVVIEGVRMGHGGEGTGREDFAMHAGARRVQVWWMGHGDACKWFFFFIR
jgi:hypothetical protein